MTTKTTNKALVTGGGGFLGKTIVKLLINRGNDVTTFSRSFYPELEELGVTQITGDISDPKKVDQAAEGMDVVFHTAAKAGVWGAYPEYYQTNVVGTENVISSCRKHHVRRLIYTSSASVVYHGKDMMGEDESAPYPNQYMTHYPKTKALAEQTVIKATNDNLLTMTLRPHLIWGPGDNHLIPRVLQRANRLVQVGNGKNIADTIYIDNAAEAHILAADKLLERPMLSGRVYFISQGDLVPVWDMINQILEAGGHPPIERAIPAELAWIIGALLEIIYKIFRIKTEPQMTRFVARELSTSHWYDINAAKKDLGYTPTINTEEGFIRLRKWLREKKNEGNNK